MRLICLAVLACVLPQEGMREGSREMPFTNLFNQEDLKGFKVDEKVKKHWTVTKDGHLRGEGKDVHLWTEKEFGDCVLNISYRLAGKVERRRLPVILPDGSIEKFEDGTPITKLVNDAGESGIFLRGSKKAKIDIWCLIVGSGGFEHYRNDEKSSAETREKCTPRAKADNRIGEWNDFLITIYKEWVTVNLNGTDVVRRAHLPGLPAKGPIGIRLAGVPIEIDEFKYNEGGRGGPPGGARRGPPGEGRDGERGSRRER